MAEFFNETGTGPVPPLGSDGWTADLLADTYTPAQLFNSMSKFSGRIYNYDSELLSLDNFKGWYGLVLQEANEWTDEQLEGYLENFTPVQFYKHYMNNGNKPAITAAQQKIVDDYPAFGPDNPAPVPTPGPDPDPTDPDEDWEQTGNTVELTTGVDVVGPEAEEGFQTTARNDLIEGVVSALPTVGTLNRTDQIDGGAGEDTLSLELKGSFTSGFSGDGYLKNVERLKMENTTNNDVTFNLAGSEDVETVILHANDRAFTLNNAQDTGLTFELTDANAERLYEIKYATGVATASDDNLKLVLKDVGTAKTSTAAAKYVDIKSTDIEELEVVSLGAINYAELAKVDKAESITVTGSGDLNVKNVAASVEVVDASKATGDLTLDLTGATAIKEAKLGSGDDSVIIDALKAPATLDGGEGDDTLTFKGMDASITSATISGFQNIVFEDYSLTTGRTFIADNVTDLEQITVKNGLGAQTLTVADTGLESLDLLITNTGTTSAGTLRLVDVLDLNVTVDADKTATTNAGIAETTILNANQATSLDLTVAADSEYTGNVSAKAALSATLNLEGELGGNILNLGAAESVVINIGFDGELAASTTLNAKSATSLKIDAKGTFTDFADGNLDSLADLTVTGYENVVMNTVEIGKDAQSVVVDATGLKSTSAFQSKVAAYAGEDAGVLIFTGSDMGNTLTIEGGRNVIDVTGSRAENDTVTITKAISGASDITLNLSTISTGDKLILGDNTTQTFDFSTSDVTLIGVNEIDATGTVDLKMKAADISGQDIEFGGSTAFQNMEFIGTDGADTIDFSGVTATLGDATAEYFTIKGGDGADIITAAELVATGVQLIIGGEGADSIYLNADATDASASNNAVVVAYEATTFAGMEAEGKDTIYNFTDGTDVIAFASGLLAASGGTALNATGASVQNLATDANFSGAVDAATSAGIIQITGSSRRHECKLCS